MKKQAGEAQFVERAPRRVPTQRRARARVDQILAATAELLEQREDLGSFTTADIAARAGVPIGSVYQYFPNKQAAAIELYRRALERIDARVAAAVDRETDPGSWRDEIDRVLAASLAGARAEPVMSLLHDSLPRSLTRDLSRESDSRSRREFLAWIERAGQPLPTEQAEMVGAIFIAAVNGVQDLIAGIEDPARAERYLAETQKLIRGYLGRYL